MKNKALFLTIIASATLGTAQTAPTAKTSLADTITWLANFSATHGVVMEHNNVVRANSISGGEGCKIEIDTNIPRPKDNSSVKHLTARVNLSQIENVVWLTDKAAGAQPHVRLEGRHSDAAIDEVSETGDGLTTTAQSPEIDLLFDSADAAAQFAHGIDHAISLCGGSLASK